MSSDNSISAVIKDCTNVFVMGCSFPRLGSSNVGLAGRMDHGEVEGVNKFITSLMDLLNYNLKYLNMKVELGL